MKGHKPLFLILISAALYLWIGQARAQTTYDPNSTPVSERAVVLPPGRLNARLDPRDPKQVGQEIRQILQQPRTLSAQAVPTITAEIQTLATGLEDDPLAIYDYVHNHVDHVPTWGLLKNPRETLLASVGNAFDQSALLSALLGAAGFETRYVWGNVWITKTAAMNWVGATDPGEVGNVFASGGIPTADYGDELLLSHVWIEVWDQGEWHALDPSFKTYREQAGQDLSPTLGYADLSEWISDAQDGAIISDRYVQHLNYTQVQTHLTHYTLNLLDHLRGSEPFADPATLIGQRQIVPVQSTAYPATLPYAVEEVLGKADDVPDDLSYVLNIQLPGLDYSAYVDEIAGERITIFYQGATAADNQILKDAGSVYDVYPACAVQVVPKLRIGGQVVATGSLSVTLGTKGQTLDVTLSTPIAGWSPAFSQFLTAGEWYALPLRLQTVSNRALSRQIDLLDEAIAQGLAPDDEPVLGQILHLLGMSYFNQVDLGDRIDSRLAGVVHVPHFAMMIASRNVVVHLDNYWRPEWLEPASHTVDVQLHVDSVLSAQNPADEQRTRAWFLNAGMRGSAVEHAILEQLQPISAVSTVQILRLAIQEGQRIYYVTADTLYPHTILELEHASQVLNAVINDVSNGRHVLIPQHEVTYGEWTGSGWITLDPQTGSASYLISGGLGSVNPALPSIISGGSGAGHQQPEESAWMRRMLQAVRQVVRPTRMYSEQSLVQDTIDVVTGNFVYRHRDLAPLGRLGTPLYFERFYASSQNNLTSTLGYGWSHSYNTRFYTNTDWTRVFGGRTALEASPALVAAQMGLSLFDTADLTHTQLALDVVAAGWLMDQVTDNAATLVEPDGSVSAHLRLVDDTYQPSAGATHLQAMTLAGDGSITLDWQDGTHMSFTDLGGSTGDKQGCATALDDANDNRTTLDYDGQGRLSQVTDAVGRRLTFSYDPQGRLDQVTGPAGRVLQYSYDAQGNLQSYTNPAGGITRYAYDGAHRLISVTDPMSVTCVTYQYDALGRVSRQVDSQGGESHLLYGGDQTVLINPLGYRTTYRYTEPAGRLLSIQDALGRRTSFTYDAADHMLSHTNALSQTSAWAYDAWGHLVTTTDALGYTMTWTYDAHQNPIRYTDPLGQRRGFTYDEQHNLIKVIDPLSHTTVYTYDEQGQLTQVRDPAGFEMMYTYDAHGNLTGVLDATRAQTAYDYDANDGLIRITDANGHTTAYQRDPLGHVLTVTDPLSRSVGFDYDAAERLTAIERADGSQIHYLYDALGHLTGVDYPAGPGLTYHYDAAGHLTGASYGSEWSATYFYDGAGQLSTVQDHARDLTLDYMYDDAGRRSRLRVMRNTNVLCDLTYSYDATGRLSALIDQSTGLTTTIGLRYDAAGRRVRVTDPTGAHADYAYDAAGRLQSVIHRDAWDAPIATYDYGHDARGNTTLITETTPVGSFVTRYTYDALNRLTAEIYPRYAISTTYDATGNLIRRTDPLGTLDLVYDAADQLQSRGSERFDHDPHGNVIHWQNAGGTYTYTYDYGNLLTDLILPDGIVLAFNYDAFGRRLTAQGTMTHPTTTQGTMIYPIMTQGFLHDGLDILLTGDANLGQTTAHYLYGERLLLGRQTDSLGFTAYHGDGLENVRYLLDRWGQPFDTYRADAFGRPAHPAGLDPTPFRFLGQRGVYQHDLPGWPTLLIGWRYYDPNGGRFLTRDPLPGDLRRPFSLNSYNEASNDPAGLRDWETYIQGTAQSPATTAPPAPQTPAAGALASGATTRQAIDSPFASLPGTTATPFSTPRQRDARYDRLYQILQQITQWPQRLTRFGPSRTSGIQAAPEVTVRWSAITSRNANFTLACTTDEHLLAGAFHTGLYHSSDARHNNWDLAYSASIGELFIDANTYYAGTWQDGVLKSSNGGDSWAPANVGLQANDVYALAAAPPHLFAGTEMGLFLSADGGAHWERPAGALPGRLVSELAFAGDVLLAVTDLGLYRSQDSAASWSQPTNDLPMVRINILLPGQPAGTVYAGTAWGLYRSTDYGDTWNAWGPGLAGQDVHALAIDPVDPNHLVAGTTAGLFISDDGGDTWTADTQAGLDGIAAHVGALAFCPAGGDANLYLGTGNGVYALRIPVPPEGVTVEGPTNSVAQVSYTFTATVHPISTTMPLTYVWQATDAAPIVRDGISARQDSLRLSWETPGTKQITVTVHNSVGLTYTTHSVEVFDKEADHEIYLPLVLRQR